MSLSRGRASRRVLPGMAGALVAGALVAAVSLATGGTPIAAAAARSSTSAGTVRPHLSLVSQSNWVTPSQAGGPATFTLALSVVGAPADARVAVSLYPKLLTRSGFEATLHSPPSQSDGSAISQTTPVTLSNLPADPLGGIGLRITVVPASTGGSPPPGGGPALDLTCSPSNQTCTGVYPVVVTLQSPSGSTLRQLTTYLTYAQSTSADRLRFAWVVPLSATTSVRGGATEPAKALTPISTANARSLTGLVTALHEYPVPVTIEPVPQTVQALAASGAGGRAAVSELAAMSTHPSVDETIAQTYVPVDLGSLAGAGEPTEITAQVKRAEAVLQEYKVQTEAPTTWVTTGQVGASTGTGLAQVGAKQVVLPDTQLAAPTTGNGGTWASPFRLPFGGRGPTLTAAASDSVLASHFTADPGDPALAAAQLLADLSMIHFERPDTATPRGVVAVPPSTWHATRVFDRQLLTGLQSNPVVQPVTLSSYFSTVPMPTDATRHLQSSGGGPPLPGSLAARLSAARLRLTAFAGAIKGDPAVLTQLDQALLATEAAYRSPRAISRSVSAFDQIFGHQLSLVQLSTDRSITLTASTGWIPVTVVSGAPYTIHGTLTMSSSKFKFPQSAKQVMSLDHPTNSVRVHVEARTLGDSPVTVEFSAPGLVFARGRVTVRSTATSAVGLVLTALALAVLLGWWARTWRAGRRRKRAARDAVTIGT